MSFIISSNSLLYFDGTSMKPDIVCALCHSWLQWAQDSLQLYRVWLWCYMPRRVVSKLENFMGILSILIQVIRCGYVIMLSMCGLCNYYSHGFSSQILAPFVYGFLYVRMVAIYPPMIFFAFATAISTSFCILSFIKISKGKEYYRQYLTDLEESELNKESSTRRPHEGT